jgi:hypothetical protein
MGAKKGKMRASGALLSSFLKSAQSDDLPARLLVSAPLPRLPMP